MICKECMEEGRESEIYHVLSSATQLGYQPYYDKKGQFHAHDPNIIITEYECSNGHIWTAKGQAKACWCGWPHNQRKE